VACCAKAYARAGKTFGVDAWGGTPDDIWDFCIGNRTSMPVIIPLGASGELVCGAGALVADGGFFFSKDSP